MRSYFLFMLLVFSAGCAQKEEMKKYVKFTDDISRACLRQCGMDAYVTSFGVVNNQLKCECEKVEVSVNKVKKGRKRK